jgi:hypothetical protein
MHQTSIYDVIDYKRRGKGVSEQAYGVLTLASSQRGSKGLSKDNLRTTISAQTVEELLTLSMVRK